jgi:hypothetical protein
MTVETILDGFRNVVVKVYGATATTETAIDVSALDPPCTEVVIDEIIYDCGAATTADVLWDATADVSAYKCNSHAEHACFTKFGGLPNSSGAGKTGDVLVTTVGTGGHTVIIKAHKVGTIFPL